MIDLRSAPSQVVQALKRLKEPGNEAFSEFLAGERDTATQKLVSSGDMVQIHRLQGRAEAMQDLLRAIEESVEAEQVRKR